MIAPATLPREYQVWNRRWHAPSGRPLPFKGTLAWSRPALMYRGPFTFQPNSRTREYEYPWAFAQIRSRIAKGTILEIGGGVSGMQFVLARAGYDVINVDPGLEAKGRGWPVTSDTHEYIARIFGAPARLIPTTLDRAGVAPESVDVLLSISTLEHLTAEELEVAAGSIRTLLKPGGFAVLTVDLFLDLKPFTTSERNRWGSNIDVLAFLNQAGLELVDGNPAQILGFPEFDVEAVRRDRSNFLIGGDASAAQCFVARRKGSNDAKAHWV